jgi:excisionase family DNA binding protein
METVQFISTSPNALANLIDEKLQERFKELVKEFQPKEPVDFLTRKETAELLKISLVTLHQWTNKGILKAYKFGNKTYFSRKEITSQLFNSNK